MHLAEQTSCTFFASHFDASHLVGDPGTVYLPRPVEQTPTGRAAGEPHSTQRPKEQSIFANGTRSSPFVIPS